GILSILKENSNELRLRGMAIKTEFQSCGYGSKLLLFSIEQMKKDQLFDTVWCNARLNAIKFYKKHDFEEYGVIFSIDGIGDHIKMKYQIK
ncbi:GNAT family N-acetyltransferase, partial [bacterium]|nr:GNAT family N-acetyltransferase [bacterium]